MRLSTLLVLSLSLSACSAFCPAYVRDENGGTNFSCVGIAIPLPVD